MIELRGAAVSAGGFRLSGVDLTVPAGAFGVLMGRTGSGKSTLLEVVCGLRRCEAGRVLLDGRDVTDLRPAERGIGYVPQDGALFETMTVGEHLAFALRIRGAGRAEIGARVTELAALLGLESLLHRMPRGLSGGERQRTALGRALSFRPRVLCLDEPLSALDDETRRGMCGLLAEVKRATGVTALHVTHSRQEADLLGDVVFELAGGVLRPTLGKDQAPHQPRAPAGG